MKTFDVIEAAARPGAAFSNGSEWEAWSARWCEECVNDVDQTTGGCPILLVAMLGERTPAEWEPDQPGTLRRPYRCTEFTPLEAP